MKALYFDCFSGVSGDMTLGALLDLGLVSEEELCAQLETLHVAGWSLSTQRVSKHGIGALHAKVHLEEDHEHDHDHDHSHDHSHDHDHDHEHAHSHDHDHDHDHPHEHSHEHRTFTDIVGIIEGSGITEGAKRLAKGIFRRVAEAEGKVHGKPPEEVGFHEVGAVDSIVDIVGTAVLIDALHIDAFYCSVVNDGRGFTRCQHGKIPVPVPAVVQIFTDPKVRMRQLDIPHELVTPTGAAIVAELCERFGPMPEMQVSRVGYGAGTRDIEIPNVLRVSLGEVESAGAWEPITVLECNLDDCSAEVMGYAMERLFEQGARDVFFAPIQMKKNRPGTKLTVLCAAERAQALADCLLAETSTIGVRMREERRICLPREAIRVLTPYGEIAGKRVEHLGIRRSTPEYESAREAAQCHGVPLREVYAAFECASRAGE